MLRYPRGISTIRNSSEELPQISNAAPQPTAQYPQLPLSLRDSGKDAIPSLSNSQTPVSQEAVLLEISSTIKRERIRQVAILATDPLDTLFLTRFIRSAAPNTRVITVGADLLFARAAQKWNLQGTLAVTSYPLLSRNQYYARVHSPRRTQFASTDSEGEYNACRRMLLPPSHQSPDPKTYPDPLCNSDLAQDAAPDKRQDFLLDYASPFAGLHPPGPHSHKPSVWITVLGPYGWWPIAAFDSIPDSDPTQPSTLFQGPQPAAHQNEKFTVEDDPPVWFIFSWAILVACALHVLLVFAMNTGYREALWRSPRFRVLAWSFNPHEIGRRRSYLAFATLVVAVTSAILVATILASGLAAHGKVQLSFAAITCLGALIEVVWIARGARWRWWIFAATAIAIFAVIRTAGPSTFGYANRFAAYRSVHVESGASPLLPFMLGLLSVYLFLWFRLQQLRKQEDRSPVLPDSELLHLSVDSAYVQHLSPAQKQSMILGSLVILLLWLLLFNPVDALATLERPAYRLLIISIISLLVYLLSWTVLRFVSAWGLLRKLLQALERHPLRYAFSRLPKDFSWTTIWTGDPRPNFQAQARSLDVLRTFAGDPANLQYIEIMLNTLNDPERNYRLYKFAPGLEHAYNAWVALAALEQEPSWNQGAIDSISSREEKDKVPKEWTKDKLAIAREEFLALRYVPFIRFGLRQMRSSFEFLSYGFILLVATLNLYPYQGRHEIDIALVIAFLLLAGSVITAFAQMDRDPLLSRLSNTKPNELDRDFIWRVVSFSALPLLTLVASLVPQFGGFLSSWIQPTLQALK